MRARLQSQYKDTIPEKIVLMALESVDYSEEKALKILDIVIQEDKDSKKKIEKKKSDAEKNVSFKDTRWVAAKAPVGREKLQKWEKLFPGNLFSCIALLHKDKTDLSTCMHFRLFTKQKVENCAKKFTQRHFQCDTTWVIS